MKYVLALVVSFYIFLAGVWLGEIKTAERFVESCQRSGGGE